MFRRCVLEAIDQWDELYPSKIDFEKDIQIRTLYAAWFRKRLVACAVLNSVQEPEYATIPWRYLTEPIGVVHRLMVAPQIRGKGVARALMLRLAGCFLFVAGTMIYIWSLRHLRDNYSPCYDSHAPRNLVRTGPYRIIRHPMYAGKWLVGIATLLVSGSLWFVVPTLYLGAQTFRTITNEEAGLEITFAAYGEYKKRTARLVPFLG